MPLSEMQVNGSKYLNSTQKLKFKYIDSTQINCCCVMSFLYVTGRYVHYNVNLLILQFIMHLPCT